MKIPMCAFGFLVLAVAALGSSRSVYGADAPSKGNFILLKAALSGGATYRCVFDTTQNTPKPCTRIGRMNHRLAGLEFALVGRSGDRVQLGFRSRAPQLPSSGPGRMSVGEVESQPETRYWFKPGETLKIEMQFVGTLVVTGEWMDHAPAIEPGDPPAD